MKEFSPDELKNHLEKKSSRPLLLDVRERWEYDIAHLPGSLLIPLSEIHTRLDDLDRERETIVICHHGIRSAKAVNLLTAAGFKEVINLHGGIDAWAREVDTSIPTYKK